MFQFETQSGLKSNKTLIKYGYNIMAQLLLYKVMNNDLKFIYNIGG
jgi:hypothetical protein